MGMGFAGGSVTTIDESVIAKKCKKELAAFRALVEKHSPIMVRSVIEHDGLAYDAIDEVDTNYIVVTHDKLVKTFEKKTGLIISYFYHDSAEEGDRYDDVGEAWYVDNAYQLTKAAKPFAKNIRQQHFVQFG